MVKDCSSFFEVVIPLDRNPPGLRSPKFPKVVLLIPLFVCRFEIDVEQQQMR